jgi:hypothetical protein
MEGCTALPNEQASDFNQEASFVSRIYSGFISSVKMTNVRRITVELVGPNERAIFYPLSDLIKVCRITMPFDFTAHGALQEQERYRVLLDLILTTLIEGSSRYKWNEGPFKEAYSKALNTRFKNEYILVLHKKSPSEKYEASVTVLNTKVHSIVTLETKTFDGQIQRTELIKVKSWEENLSIVKNIEWVDDHELIVANAGAEINFRCFPWDQKVDIFFTPRVHDEVFLKDELSLLNPATSQSEYLRITNKRIEELRASS